MKKLITGDLGGHPVYFKDFEFIQEQIRELAKAAFGHCDPAIVTVLNGCEVTISTDGYTCGLTEGWAVYDNEFFYIPAQTATGSNPEVIKWIVTESWDSRGLKTFSDPAVGNKDVYKIRQLYIDYVASGSPGILFSSTVFNNRSSFWTELTVNSPWIVDEPINYRLNERGKLEIKGFIHYASGIGTAVIGVLPEGFRPTNYVYMPANNFLLAGYFTPAVIEYYPNGNITLADFYTTGNGSGSKYVWINHIITLNYD